MSKKYISSSIENYLDDVSARIPAPGGGSAAALTSSLGISLLLMSANFTLNKKGYEKYNKEIKKIIDKLEKAKKKMSEFIDEDVCAYNKLSGRCGNKGKALKNAIKIPQSIFEISFDMLDVAKQLSEIANINLLSDVVCGAAMLRAGIESAKFNIDANLKYMDDMKFDGQKCSKYGSLLKSAVTKSEKIIKFVQLYKFEKARKKIWTQK